MFDSPLVSVIIPNYNHERFLKKRIDTVLKQSFQDFELIILDDHSTDGSAGILELFKKDLRVKHLLYNHQNSGNTFRQWQKGLELAKGQYIWIAESDDFSDTNFLYTMIQPFKRHPDLILSYCQSIIIDENDLEVGLLDWADALDSEKWKSDYVEDAIHELECYLTYRNTIPNASAVLFKKPENLGILQDSFRFKMGGDWIFWRKLLSNGGKIAFKAKAYNYFRQHEQSTRASTKEKELERIKEFKMLIIPSRLSLFDDKYDWMVSWWFRTRKVLKGNFQYYIPFLPPTLIIRMIWMYIKTIPRKLHRSFAF